MRGTCGFVAGLPAANVLDKGFGIPMLVRFDKTAHVNLALFPVAVRQVTQQPLTQQNMKVRALGLSCRHHTRLLLLEVASHCRSVETNKIKE